MVILWDLLGCRSISKILVSSHGVRMDDNGYSWYVMVMIDKKLPQIPVLNQQKPIEPRIIRITGIVSLSLRNTSWNTFVPRLVPSGNFT